jgi:DNA polymerase I-like protein with 3'-5' exonuclease and polymerase domains
MLRADGIDVMNCKATVHCTLILAKLFNSMLWSYDLVDLVRRFLLRSTEDKTGTTEWLKQNKRSFERDNGRAPNYTDIPIEIVKRRNIWDAESTLKLFYYFYPKVKENCPELYETERQLQFHVLDMEWVGVRVDITRARELKAQAQLDAARIRADLQKLVCPLTIRSAHCVTKGCKKHGKKKKVKTVFYDGDIPEKCPVCEGPIEVRETKLEEFNANSAVIQVPSAFIQMGIELKYKTKPKKGKKGKKGSAGGNWAFDEYAMIRYVSKPLAKVIRESGEESWPVDRFYAAVYTAVRENDLEQRELLPPLILKIRELEKMVSTYYNHIIEDAVDVETGPDGRVTGIIHCHFNQVEAQTGRFSSSGPNLQNMPRILGPRQCFITRKGRRNWHFDYEQVEMKLFCHFAKDPDMAKAISEDIHLYVAAEIYQVSIDQVTKEQRKRAKQINFGIIYGSGPDKVAETLTRMGLPTTKAEARMLFARYHRRFPSVKRTTKQLQIILAQKGYVSNPFGRRYYIPKKLGYRCLNYLCQGTSAELIKRGMLKVAQFIKANGFKSRLLIQVHDELVIEMPRTEEKILIPKIIELLEDLTSFFVPITVDAECAPRRWSHKVKAQAAGIELKKAA